MKVFISHSSVDKEFVRTLKKDLNANGIQTWFDEDQLDLGDSLIEKLDSGLTESSHFIIILSQASTNSDWVRYEIKKAIENKKLALTSKIIPIKYNECGVPEELSNLLYGNLANETRIIRGDYVEFYSPEYIKVVDKICKSIKKSEKQLSKKDIAEIKNAISKSEKEIESQIQSQILKGVYDVMAYRNKISRTNYAQIVLQEIKDTHIDLIKPILLPSLWKNVLPNIKIGDNIFVSKNYTFKEAGHFAGFRSNDTGITIDPRIRKAVRIDSGRTYKVEFNILDHLINFSSIQRIVV